MDRPPHIVIARHALGAGLMTALLVLVGFFARASYSALVRPGPGRISPLRGEPLSMALGLGFAAAAVEALYAYTGARTWNCRDYQPSAPQAGTPRRGPAGRLRHI
jgi:hypothetical protein